MPAHIPQSPETAPTKALIYCRVSSSKQATEFHGLDSQEARCRSHALHMGYEVEAVFPDDVSGAGDFMRRPGMVALLSYLDAQPDRKNYVVIFDDLKRFARDTEFHIKLRKAFRMRGARIECLNFRLEDTPEGKFIETILAAQGELEREQNSRQVVQKMKARVLAGYWCFSPPKGYRYKKVVGHGKLLVRKEPLASIIKEALEAFACGRLESVAEVKRFLESQPAYPRDHRGEVHFERVAELLNRMLYAGYIEVPKWGMSFIPAKHEPLVSLATWQRVQERLKGPPKAPVRKDLNEDFPLRGFVCCASCNQPMTACWSKGRTKHYAYYLCDTRDCPDRRKSVRKEIIEGEFETLLAALKPSAHLFHAIYEMLRDQWNDRLARSEEMARAVAGELQRVEVKVRQLVDRVMGASTSALAEAYEARLRELHEHKAALSEKAASIGKPQATFAETYRTAFAFIANPCNLWHSPRLEDRRAVLRLVFAERLAYQRGSGYQTAQTALIFKLLGDKNMQMEEVVGPAGLEPATNPL